MISHRNMLEKILDFNELPDNHARAEHMYDLADFFHCNQQDSLANHATTLHSEYYNLPNDNTMLDTLHLHKIAIGEIVQHILRLYERY